MNVAEWSLKRRSFVLFVAVLLLIGGVWSYVGLGRLEDPDFTVKTALVVTPYPGASPTEVEEEVTDEIEEAVQRLPQLKRVRSQSRRGLSVVYVDIKDEYTNGKLPQVWDELRRKVREAQRYLPPGAGPSMVNDDFGDVFGVLFALTGDGFSMADLKRYADIVKKRVLLVPDVAQVSIWGDRTEAVFVQFSRSKVTELGLSPEQIVAALQGQNLVVDSGSVLAGSLRIPLDPSGKFQSVDEIGDILIRGGRSGRLVVLRDIATVSRGYLEPPRRIMCFDGKQALALGVSTVPGGNVVRMGENVQAELRLIEADLPLGLSIETVTFQSDLVREAVDGFLMNLAEAVFIVIALLVVFMGMISGLLMGGILLLTIAGTFVAMKIMGIELHSVSLGTLIIALGMLVDNAIVVTEGILVGITMKRSREESAIRIVQETKWPLLGATLVAILAFAAIGLSRDVTGEFCRSLFQVIAASLLISWVLAVTVTPVLGVMFLRPEPGDDPYNSRGYRMYRRILTECVGHRWLTVTAAVVLLLSSIFGFRFVEQSFFPETARDQFMIHYWLPEGTDITRTAQDMTELSEHLMASETDVTSVATFAGEGPLRFYLSMEPQLPDSAYGFLLVSVTDHKVIPAVMARVGRWIADRFPDADPRFERFMKGPGTGAKIKLRIFGDDSGELRRLSREVQAIMAWEPSAIDVRDDWRQPGQVLRPVLDQARVSRSGLSRAEIAGALEGTFAGRIVGVYREGDRLLPIVVRAPEDERLGLGAVENVQVWSRGLRRFVPLGQAISEVRLVWEDPIIWRRNRSRVITPQCNPRSGTAEDLRRCLIPHIEAITLPTGYHLEWGGEYEVSRDSKGSLVAPFCLSFILMIVLVMGLFNGFRQPLVVFLCLPLAAVGVTVGLLVTGQSFGFMALVGYLSLAGMLIKNAIVLLDQIALELAQGTARFSAVIHASTGRIRPVMMAAMTTVLGMAPLALDDFFASMAVTIMFGLTFATVLTLIVVPVLYCMFYGISMDEVDVSSPM
ncbi:MAG: hypothetical protein CSA35_05945 [Dethiosulfovibrio peptidovorans]|nr:MAG: hypothetical protein CSA35_05945 [Dethiosulfovibrio peptidovorans]